MSWWGVKLAARLAFRREAPERMKVMNRTGAVGVSGVHPGAVQLDHTSCFDQGSWVLVARIGPTPRWSTVATGQFRS